MRVCLYRSINAVRFGSAVLALVGLGGCQQLLPNGASDTIALLKSGSERVCVAAEVQRDLDDLILPKASELGDDTGGADTVLAAATVSLAFDTTTLESTDKSVSKASCNTVVTVKGQNGEPGKFRINYDVSPSAEDPSHVVVSGDTDDARAFAKARMEDAVTQMNATKSEQQEAAATAQARQQLLALVTPKWLVGTWIGTGNDAAACSNGQGLTFRASHVVEGAELNGRWVLSEDHLHAVGQGTAGAAELDGTISTADPLSFTLTAKDDTTRSLRRCTREETNAFVNTGQPDTFAPTLPTQN